MKLKNALTVFAILLFFLISCKREILDSGTTKDYKKLISVTQAKAFFDTQVLANSPLTLSKKDLTNDQIIRDESVNDLLYKEPIWEKAYVKNLDGKIGLAVPIHFKVKSVIRTGAISGIDNDKLNYLLIYQGDHWELVADWVTLSPDLTWIKGDRKKFIGRIKTSDWDGNLRKMYVYSKTGRVISYKNPSENDLLTLLDYTKAPRIFGAINYTGGSLNRSITLYDLSGRTISDGRKYQDVNGDCWENIREVQNTDGVGVTLYRKKIDCATLDPQDIGDPNPDDPPLPGQGTGGSGGGSGVVGVAFPRALMILTTIPIYSLRYQMVFNICLDARHLLLKSH